MKPSPERRAVEIGLAENYANGITDDSAPRATLRAIEDSNEWSKATMTLQIMRDNRCPLPKRSPSKMTYFLDAMKCRTARMEGNSKAPECDYDNWKRAE